MAEPNVEDVAEETKVDTRTAKQIKVEEHKARAKTAAGATKTLNNLYLQAKKDPVFQNIIKVTQSFIDYHNKLAQDGVGYKENINGQGAKLQETIELSDAQRVAHLNKAAAQQEILDYIDRRSTPKL
jgi:hypothetical protein